MKALIIAAGDDSSQRSLTRIEPKALIELLGLSLIERLILTVKHAGIDQFIIVIGYLGDRIRAKLGNGDKYGARIIYVENAEWQKGNGVSVLKAKELLNENFVLLTADHILDERILEKLIHYDLGSSVVLAIDRRKPLPGDTKVLEKDGRIVDIGKKIEESNCVDTGVLLCSPKIISHIEDAMRDGNTELAHGVAEAAKKMDAETVDVGQIESYVSKMRKDIKPWWIDINTEGDLTRAKEMIIENASKNPSDALAYYVHRPIENKIVALISRFSITPNQLTIIVNILAYTVTALFFLGHLLSASILTFLVGIADGLDGKLARVKLMTSRLGSLEHSFDLLFEFSWFIALSWFLFRSSGNGTPLILCMFIILFIAFYRQVYDRFGRAMGKSLDDAGDFERMFKRVAGRRNLYNIPILVSILLAVPIYSLIFILFHSWITALVYSARAVRHMHVEDRTAT